MSSQEMRNSALRRYIVFRVKAMEFLDINGLHQGLISGNVKPYPPFRTASDMAGSLRTVLLSWFSLFVDKNGMDVIKLWKEVFPQHAKLVQDAWVKMGPAWPILRDFRNSAGFHADKPLKFFGARHQLRAEIKRVVISDSDVLVRPDFLRNVVPPLLNPRVGLVTCLYEGIPDRGLWSLLEALGMSIEMSSGVLVARMVDGMRFALGAVMAVRRDALEAMGGIRETAYFYSDDFVLGNRIAESGYEVVLSHYKVGHVLTSRSLQRTLGDQLRWMKSTRFSRPLGHIGSGLTYAVPFGLLALLLGLGHGHRLYAGFELFMMACLNRMILALVVGWGIVGDRRALWLCWLYPLRDLLGFGVWSASFSGKTFFWRGETYQFGREGRITPEQRPVTMLGHGLSQGHD